MEGGGDHGHRAFPVLGGGTKQPQAAAPVFPESKVMQRFQESFVQVQSLLDQNRLLINEINQNQESKRPGNLTRNVGLIHELNNNIRRVVDVYSELSLSFSRSGVPPPAAAEAEADGQGKKRVRPT